ncbi:hypothetical protein TSUD_15850 [Trifolium subterraneum]|uniref:Uncharacterized protein n=1 Tax=Trifolium subterraneum TaxID=3900 RepID=A0A2Z6NJ78_TRISU|nr:hypothetical protein TSUD_15850 [Trifolium subterraneum]
MTKKVSELTTLCDILSSTTIPVSPDSQTNVLRDPERQPIDWQTSERFTIQGLLKVRPEDVFFCYYLKQMLQKKGNINGMEPQTRPNSGMLPIDKRRVLESVVYLAI